MQNNIHFYGLQSVLESPDDSNSFGIVDVFSDKLLIRGFGIVQNKELNLEAV